MGDNKTSGKARGHEQDAAEKWLAENDPEYAQRKKDWQSPATDALARERRIHKDFREITPVNAGTNDGGYRKYPKSGNHYVGHSFENDSAVESDVEDEQE